MLQAYGFWNVKNLKWNNKYCHQTCCSCNSSWKQGWVLIGKVLDHTNSCTSFVVTVVWWALSFVGSNLFTVTARPRQNMSSSSCLGSGFSIIWNNFSSTLFSSIYLCHLPGVTCTFGDTGGGVCTLLLDDDCEDGGVPTEDTLSSISLCSCSCAWLLSWSLSSSSALITSTSLTCH